MADRPQLWSESWYLDFASADGTLGGFVRFGVYPTLGVAWWWAHATRVSGDAGDVVGCQAERFIGPDYRLPFELDEPDLRIHIDAVGSGEWEISVASARSTLPGPDADDHRPVPFGFDIRWQARGDTYIYQLGHRREQAGWATGTVTINGAGHPLDGPGQRDHSSGVRDWWRFGWDWSAGWLPDGRRFQATQLDSRGRVAPDGYVMGTGGVPSPLSRVEILRSRLPGASIRLQLDDLWLTLEDVATIPLRLDGPSGRSTRLDRSLVLVRHGDETTGVGWRERNNPVNGRRRALDQRLT